MLIKIEVPLNPLGSGFDRELDVYQAEEDHNE